jgi:hypothetical protein
MRVEPTSRWSVPSLRANISLPTDSLAFWAADQLFRSFDSSRFWSPERQSAGGSACATIYMLKSSKSEILLLISGLMLERDDG